MMNVYHLKNQNKKLDYSHLGRKNTLRNSPALTACPTDNGSVWLWSGGMFERRPASRQSWHYKEFLSNGITCPRSEIDDTHSAEVFMKLFSAATRLLSLGKDEGVSLNSKLLSGFP